MHDDIVLEAAENTELGCPHCDARLTLADLGGWSNLDLEDIDEGRCTVKYNCPHCLKPIEVTTDTSIEVNIHASAEKGQTKADKEYLAWKDEKDQQAATAQ